MKNVFKIRCGWDDVRPEVGKAYILISRLDVMTDNETYYIRPWYPEQGGVPGILNNDIRRFHGWRGSYNNVSLYAHGVREVKEIISVDEEWGQTVYKVRFTNVDLVADQD